MFEATGEGLRVGIAGLGEDTVHQFWTTMAAERIPKDGYR